MDNIKYKSDDLLKKYSCERNTWDEFYESEKKIMERVFNNLHSGFSVLDAGCGCGGLAKAMQERGYNCRYKGIDISEENIQFAAERTDITLPHEFISEDISKYNDKEKYDVVMSLSCIDWNNDVDGMLKACWDKVKMGGYLIASFRLTKDNSLLSEAYQYIDSNNTDITANYVVFNYVDLLNRLNNLNNKPVEIGAYGYWGKPSPTAVVPYERICFSVFYIKKDKTITYSDEIRICLELPISLFI